MMLTLDEVVTQEREDIDPVLPERYYLHKNIFVNTSGTVAKSKCKDLYWLCCTPKAK